MQSSNLPPPDHYLQLWFSNVGDESTVAERQIINQLSPSEKKRLKTTKNVNKRREFLLSRSLMRHALSQYFDSPEGGWKFIEQVNSIPEVRNLPDNTFLSLTHSNGLICFAITNCPVGVDLEMTEQRDFLDLAKIFMTEKEYVFLSLSAEKQSEIFYRIWCAKEASYKALSLTEQSSTNFNDISILALTNRDKDWFLLEWKIKQFILAVVIEKKPRKICHNYYSSPTNPQS